MQKIRWASIALVVCGLAALALSPVAGAHGPCPECVEPEKAVPGGELAIDYPTFKAVFNPTRQQLTKGPKPHCYGCQLGLWRARVEGVPAVELGTWRPRRDQLSVRAPDVPTGRYLVALWDGSEGGTHYTWDFVRIDGPADNGSNDTVVVVLLGGAAILALAVAGMARVARRRKRAD